MVVAYHLGGSLGMEYGCRWLGGSALWRLCLAHLTQNPESPHKSNPSSIFSGLSATKILTTGTNRHMMWMCGEDTPVIGGKSAVGVSYTTLGRVSNAGSGSRE